MPVRCKWPSSCLARASAWRKNVSVRHEVYQCTFLVSGTLHFCVCTRVVFFCVNYQLLSYCSSFTERGCCFQGGYLTGSQLAYELCCCVVFGDVQFGFQQQSAFATNGGINEIDSGAGERRQLLWSQPPRVRDILAALLLLLCN